MWVFAQGSGDLIDPDAQKVATGYSGTGAGRNNPAMQHVKQTGPIPRGRWRISAPYDSQKVGPYALPLHPEAGTETFGRGDFRIHGNNAANDASEGCIILPKPIRVKIWQSGDRELLVI